MSSTSRSAQVIAAQGGRDFSGGQLWLNVPDEAAADSDRGFLEQNAIALLSGAGRRADPPGETWLGRHSFTGEISTSGLWNMDFIGHPFDDRFLDVFSAYVEITLGRSSQPGVSLAPKGWHPA